MQWRHYLVDLYPHVFLWVVVFFLTRRAFDFPGDAKLVPLGTGFVALSLLSIELVRQFRKRQRLSRGESEKEPTDPILLIEKLQLQEESGGDTESTVYRKALREIIPAIPVATLSVSVLVLGMPLTIFGFALAIPVIWVRRSPPWIPIIFAITVFALFWMYITWVLKTRIWPGLIPTLIEGWLGGGLAPRIF